MNRLFIGLLLLVGVVDVSACIKSVQSCSRGKELECVDVVNEDGEVVKRKCKCVLADENRVVSVNEYQSCKRGQHLECATRREGQRQPNCECVEN